MGVKKARTIYKYTERESRWKLWTREEEEEKADGIKEMRASREAFLCLQTITAAERREEEGFLEQADMLLPKTLSFIRIDMYVPPCPSGHAVTPVPSVVGEASMSWQGCVCAYVYVCVSVCVSLRFTVSHPGSQAEATDQVM